MNTSTRILPCVTPDDLVEEYETVYVDHLEASECDDLEDRLQSAFRVSSLAERMKAAGLEARVQEIHDAYRS